MPRRFSLHLSDDLLDTLEDERRRLGARSLADTMRALIRRAAVARLAQATAQAHALDQGDPDGATP